MTDQEKPMTARLEWLTPEVLDEAYEAMKDGLRPLNRLLKVRDNPRSPEEVNAITENARAAMRRILEVAAPAEHTACPCLHTTPCHPRCTCVLPISSSGCRRCCSYGSASQRKAKAEYLVAKLEAAAQESETPHEEVETPCSKRSDEQHCNCWYDGEACCACGSAAMPRLGTTTEGR